MGELEKFSKINKRGEDDYSVLESISFWFACWLKPGFDPAMYVANIWKAIFFSFQVLVFDVDSGQKIWAPADQLYALSEELRWIPEIAKRAALAGIEVKNRVTNATSVLRERINKVIHGFCQHFLHSTFAKNTKKNRCYTAIFAYSKAPHLRKQFFTP